MAKSTTAPKSTPKKSGNGFSTNLDKLKALRNSLLNGTGSGSSGEGDKWLPFFKLDVNEKARVRILPLGVSDLPFILVSEHRNVYPNYPNRQLVCPKSVGAGDCPVCDFVFPRYKDAKENDDENAMAVLKKSMPKKRVYAIIYNYATKRVEKLGMSEMLLKQMLNDWDGDEDIADVYNGCAFKISCLPKSNVQSGQANKSYMASKLETYEPLFKDDDGEADEDAIKAVLQTIEDHKAEIEKLRSPIPTSEIEKLLNPEVPASDDDEDATVASDDEEEDVDDVLAEARALHAKAKGKASKK